LLLTFFDKNLQYQNEMFFSLRIFMKNTHNVLSFKKLKNSFIVITFKTTICRAIFKSDFCRRVYSFPQEVSISLVIMIYTTKRAPV